MGYFGILTIIRINVLFYLFFTVVPFNSGVFIFCRPFVVNTTFSTGLVGVEVSSRPTRPVENVALTTKGPKERITKLLDVTTVKNG